MWKGILDGPAEQVAPRLLGCRLVRTLNGLTTSVKIVETEAYSAQDAASHSYRGRTPRTDVMFGPPGFLYVYFTYGMHFCCNIVTGHDSDGSAVLIRAVEPLNGLEILESNRPGHLGLDLTNGPAKLCQALGIDRVMNGHDLRCEPLRLVIRQPLLHEEIIQTTLVGISQAKDVPWRFYIAGNPYVSKK